MEVLAPALEALVRGEHGRGALVAPVDELEEGDGAATADGEASDLVDDREPPVGEGLETLIEASRGLRLLERVDQVDLGALVDPPVIRPTFLDASRLPDGPYGDMAHEARRMSTTLSIK